MIELVGAREVADAVLYEGYVLYPYRASSPKNQVRFQWGVLMPGDVVALDPSERRSSRTTVVVDGRRARLEVLVRCLQVQRRRVEARTTGGFLEVPRLDTHDTAHVPWDEAVERETTIHVPLADQTATRHDWDLPGGEDHEDLLDERGDVVGRLVRTREPVRVTVAVEVTRPPSPYGVALVRVDVGNDTPAAGHPGATRPDWLRRAAVAAHLLLRVADGAFVSLLDPPQWARGYVDGCVHDGLFPVLMGRPGDAEVMLCSPIILYDHPQVAEQSTSTFFDALEIDELLSLRTMTLSEEEKREMRGTDPRTAALLDEVESISPDLWDRLHGTVRYLDGMTGAGSAAVRPPDPEAAAELSAGGPGEVPWWDPGADTSVDPGVDTVRIGTVEVGRGSRVVLRPGKRRADALDMFLAGREATVAGVFHDVDEGLHLAVTVDDDPGADLKDSHGRYLYFAPDEVEPLRSRSEGARP
ncbi:MAG TPA: hypothetical protein VFG97_05080 [Pedococcus sp.]|nr:hypothetical protein [Pedococcus sp.]